jgi:rhamnulokinase
LNTLYQLYAASQRTPRLLAVAEALLTIPDLLNNWLAGVQVCEYTEATTTQFLDRRNRTWACSLLSDLGIPTHFLKGIVQPGTVLGSLRAELAQADSLKAAVVTAPACHDTGSAVAAVKTGGSIAFLSSGTWSLLGTEVPEAIVSADSRRFNFTNEGGVGGTYRLLKNITGMWLLEECRKAWGEAGQRLSYGELCGMASTEEPARTLIDPDDPLFTAPENMPRAIDAFCARTSQPAPRSPGAYTRAILESLALKYRLVLEQLCCVTGAKIDQVRVIGGGCRNAMLNQFTADATGCRVMAGPAEATALGNIAMQMVGVGAIASIDDARALIERSFPVDVFEPAGGAIWERAYANFRGLT